MFEWLIKELFRLCINAASYFIQLIITTFTFDLTYFTDKIPIVGASYSIFQTMALGMTMLFLIWQCLKALGAPISMEADDPISVFLKSILAVFCIYNAQALFNIGFETLRPIYDRIVGLVWFIFMWAFLKVAQKLDQLLGKLGIEVGSVGGTFAEELMVAKAGIKLFGGKGNPGNGSGGLAAAMQTATNGGGAAVVGAGLIGRAVTGIASGMKNQYKKSPVAGVINYHRSGGAEAFSRAKDVSILDRTFKRKPNDTVGGKIANNISGAAAWAKGGLRQVSGANAITGKRIASQLNNGEAVNYKYINQLNNPTVAANMLGNLHQMQDDDSAKKMLEGIMGGKDLGDLKFDNLDDVKCKAYNGGIHWSYEATGPPENGGGKTKFEGIVAINGNNDASRQVQRMRNTTPGVSANTVKRNGVEITYASKKTT